MSSPKIFRSSSKIPRAIFTIFLMIGGLFGTSEASQHRILECEHQGVSQCRLVTKKLLQADLVLQFSDGEIQKATFQSHKNSRYIYSEVILATTKGDLWLTANDNLQMETKQRLTEEINAFLANPHSGQLRADPGYNAIFWIAIFGFLPPILFSCVFFPRKAK
jgi:hypothetical protein